MNVPSIAKSTVTTQFLRSREKSTCHALSNDDIKISREFTIDFLHEANKIARVLGLQKPVTIFATEDEKRVSVSSDDLWVARRYENVNVQSMDAIRPVQTFLKLRCPSCNKIIMNTEPSFILPPCPSGCGLHVSRWEIVEKGGFRDVASGYIVLNGRGKQVVKFYVESFNIDVNANYSKLQMASAGIPVTIDAIPFVECDGKDARSFSLWITRAVINTSMSTRQGKIVSFTIEKPPSSEKDAVMSLFFSNLEFMRVFLGFHAYQLQRAFPDLLIRCNDGRIKTVEFELESRNFDAHGHDAIMTDYIVCWVHNRERDDGVPVIELRALEGKSLSIVP